MGNFNITTNGEKTMNKTKFEDLFPTQKSTVFCPYRICPLGAHVDHQFGAITGFAIDKGITIEYSATEDGMVEAVSVNMPEKKTFNVKHVPKKVGDWADHLRGAARMLRNNGYELTKGAKCLIEGSLPIGGLSSSASVIIAFMTVLCKVNNISLTQPEIISIAQQTENKYVGVSCGTLDQSCEVYSKKDHLLHLDTKDGTYELIKQSADMPEYEIGIFFSGVPRSLAGTKYNMRVDECKSAAYYIMAMSGMEYGKYEEATLRNIPYELFLEWKDKLPESWRKRAEHYYSEQERVRKGAELWRKGDLEGFGKLIFESGHSSIYSYETGSPELKALYEAMLHTEGIYGGRFSGAGFKGCCMALIDPKYKDEITKKISEEYLSQFPELEGAFEIHYCRTADGVKF